VPQKFETTTCDWEAQRGISTLIRSASHAVRVRLPLVRSHFVRPRCVGRIRHLRALSVRDARVQQVGVLRNLRACERQRRRMGERGAKA
jgi:hypothetical protein